MSFTPSLDLSTSDEHGLNWFAEARFGHRGTLHYNRWYRHPKGSYSVNLHPDFAWHEDGQAHVIFDAKFRLEWPQNAPEAGEEALTTATLSDLYKMHTYRDALRARAAVAVYPGRELLFYTQVGKEWPDDSNRDTDQFLVRLLAGDLTGIGALPLRPGLSTSDLALKTEGKADYGQQ